VNRRKFIQLSTTVLGAAASSQLRALEIGDTSIGSDNRQAKSRSIGFDERSLFVDGKRRLLISGEIHYPRSTRQMWPSLLDRSKALGLNCIATYVFWNVHERERDRYDFTADRDLGYFLRLCQERDLLAFLRVGPYCCAEWNFGGFPPYLRDEPNITLRTMSKPYLDRVDRYFVRLSEEIRPYLLPNGGPVGLIQVENEYANVAKRYGDRGEEYLRWIVDLAERVGFKTIPTTTCEGGASGSIETLNGNGIPPERAAKHQLTHPKEPLLWSELYPGWYDIWGWPRHPGREPREIATNILEFLAEGGAGWNYYMWHGGTNFGRNSMYLQTTSYDFTAPLDEYGRSTPKGEYLGGLHHALKEHELLLLGGQRTTQTLAPNFQKTTWNVNGQRLELLVNRGRKQQSDAGCTVSPDGACLRMQDGLSIFHTDQRPKSLTSVPTMSDWEDVDSTFAWEAWHEPFPGQGLAEQTAIGREPIEQLALTRDKTDYCWYSTTIQTTKEEEILTIPYGGDLLYVFLDGECIGRSAAPLLENRGYIVPVAGEHQMVLANPHESPKTDGYRNEIKLSGVKAGSHRLDILTTAVGMIKGDWQITAPMNMERKGIWSHVELSGQTISSEWCHTPFLRGELLDIVTQPDKQHWLPRTKATVPLTWHKTTFSLSSTELSQDADYRVKLNGLQKGMLFINGCAVGRYWQISTSDTEHTPTQDHYHIPHAWLKNKNVLIVFEEAAVAPDGVRLQRRRAAPL
jgi:hypothetical protein